MNIPTGEQILALPMPPMPEKHADVVTVGDYLIKLLTTLWDRKHLFDGKRPHGYSGWKFDLYIALGRAGLIPYQEDEDGDCTDVDVKAGDQLIASAIQALGETHIRVDVAVAALNANPTTDPDLDRPEREGYSLVVPFIVCKSKGGPYDDDAYVAGFEAGGIDRALVTAAAACAVSVHFSTVHTAQAGQLELIGMARDYPTMRVETSEEWPEWSAVTFYAAGHAPPSEEGYLR